MRKDRQITGSLLIAGKIVLRHIWPLWCVPSESFPEEIPSLFSGRTEPNHGDQSLAETCEFITHPSPEHIEPLSKVTNPCLRHT